MMSSTTSKFEDLLNEIYLKILKYLSGFSTYIAFEDLNSRFRLLLKNYSYSFKCLNNDYFAYLCLKILPDITPKAICSLTTYNTAADCIEELFLTAYNIKQFT